MPGNIVRFWGEVLRRYVLSAVAACIAAAVLVPSAHGRSLQPRPWHSVSDSGSTAAEQRVDPTGLPAAQENLELVSELNPQTFGGVRAEEIADLAVHKGFAYLNSWDSSVACDRGGVYVIDIRDPAQPKEIAYIPPVQPFYHGEGAHVISMDTPQFKGDLLAVNNETWGSNLTNTCGPGDTSGGGFDLYDVSDPANPKVLVQGAGDRDGGDGPLGEQETTLANSFHSVFVWQAGPRAFLAASDNIELTDVDVFDITDPKNPVQVGDYDLADMFPQILTDEKANGSNVFNHDMVVKRIGSSYRMIVSNWDSGYVQIDVTDPANPTYVTDTTTGLDAYRPTLFGEGNAHYSELSSDNQFLLAANEDFSPTRTVLTGATTNKSRTAAEGGDNTSRVADLPDGKLNGQTVWAGNGCEGAAFDTDDATDPEFPAAPADDGDPNTDRIALVERGGPTITQTGGGCGFAQKIDNARVAGFDGLVIFNQVRPDDGQVNMLTDNGDGLTIPAVQMRRVDALGPEGAITPATTRGDHGTAGPDVTIESLFDGWGDAQLYDAQTSELLDSFSIPEAQDPRYQEGFGDLSIHEFATDPTEPVAYSAYYAGGMRVFRFSRTDGLVQTGKFIDDDSNGSNFWGVEQFTGSDGQRYIAGSDRDFGLQIFRYTGPARPQRPACSDVSATTAFETPIELPLVCTDPNSGNTLTLRITRQPSGGTLGNIVSGRIGYFPAAGFAGTDSFAYTASDGAAEAAPATVSVTVSDKQYEVPYYVIKKRPGLRAKVRPQRDRRKPFRFRVSGLLRRPSGVSRTDGCRGRVRITARKVRKGKDKRLARRTVRVRSSCRYSARLLLRRTGKRGKARFTVSFRGNTHLTTRTVRRTARFGKKRKK